MSIIRFFNPVAGSLDRLAEDAVHDRDRTSPIAAAEPKGHARPTPTATPTQHPTAELGAEAAAKLERLENERRSSKKHSDDLASENDELLRERDGLRSERALLLGQLSHYRAGLLSVHASGEADNSSCIGVEISPEVEQADSARKESSVQGGL